MRCFKCVPFLFLALTLACRKDPPAEPTPVRYIPQELKDYWDFKPGTYWIYKDSVSGAIDSVYVTQRSNYTGTGVLNYTQKPIVYEYLQINTRSSLDGHDYDYWINTQAGGSIYQDYNVVFSSKSTVDTHKSFVYPITEGNITYQGYGSVETDSCIVKSVYTQYNGFANVVKIVNTFNSFEGYKHTSSYYAFSVGLIRYEVPDSNKYRILDHYHIEQ